jgi:ABC-type bacteriocin/lantibiotic exporter with double-glycine peptidase domain
MIEVPYYHQKKEYTCGPAVLKMVFDFFDVHLKEEKLKKEMRTSKKRGTKHERLIKTALREGFYCYVHDNSSISQIKHFVEVGFPVIVHYIEPSSNDGHYSVVVGYKRNKLIMNDPWNGENYKIKLKEFEKRWHSQENSKQKRWIIVLSKNKFNLGRQYSPK